MPNKFVSIGECMVELSGGDQGIYRLGFAGDALNTAWYALGALGTGWTIEFLSALGDDIYSASMRNFIYTHGIGTQHIPTLRGKRCGLYLIHQEEGDRRFTYWRDNSAARHLADDEEWMAEALRDASMIFFSGITLAILPTDARKRLLSAISTARANGARVAFDPNIRPALWVDKKAIRYGIERAASVVDIVLPTFDDEIEAFNDVSPAATVQRYQAMGVNEIVVKNGSGTVLIAAGSDGAAVPAIPTHVVDSTGAGDSFNGAYLSARLQGETIFAAAATAHETASRVIQYPGGLVSL